MKFEQFSKLFLLFLAKTVTAHLGGISGDIEFNIFAFLEISVRIGTQQVGHSLPFCLLCYERVLSEEFSCAVEGSELIETDLHPNSLLDIFRQSLIIRCFTKAAVDFTKSAMAVDTVRIDKVRSLDQLVFKVVPTD